MRLVRAWPSHHHLHLLSQSRADQSFNVSRTGRSSVGTSTLYPAPCTPRGSVGTSTSASLPELSTQLGSKLGAPTRGRIRGRTRGRTRGRPVMNDLAIDGALTMALTMDNLHLGGIRSCRMHACRMHLLQGRLRRRVWPAPCTLYPVPRGRLRGRVCSGGKHAAPLADLAGLAGRDLPEIGGGRDRPEIGGGRDRPEIIEGRGLW